jgi:hypothetical protein
MNILMAVVFAAAATAAAPVPAARVAEDARVVDRVAEVSRGDLPQDLLRRMVNEDLDLLRGKRADGTYTYAAYERLESGRISQSYSIDPSAEDHLSSVEVKGTFAYRVVLDVPSRRLLVRKNNPVFVDRVEIEYMPQTSSATKTQVVKVGAWLEPGTLRPFDLEEIGRQATVRVFARSDKKTGYGNLGLMLLQAKVVDLPESPYADAVGSIKAIQRGIERRDIESIRTMAQRIVAGLTPTAASSVVNVVAPAVPAAAPAEVQEGGTVTLEMQAELQAIEDLLTGTDLERRQGMDRLHQLIRRLRSR